MSIQTFDYSTLTVRITGGRSGVLSAFLSKGINEDDLRSVQELGRLGWELISAVPVIHGALATQSTDAAVCFFRRARGKGTKPDVAAEQDHDARHGANEHRATSPHRQSLSGEEFDVLLERDRLRSYSAAGNFRLTESDWTFISSNRVPEAIGAVEDAIRNLSDPSGESEKPIIQQFYAQLTRNEAAMSLYRLAADESTFSIAYDLMQSLELFDFERIKAMLASSKRSTKLNALRLMFIRKGVFHTSEAQSFGDLMNAVEAAFPIAEVHEKKSLLGKLKRYWMCPNCSAEKDESASVCECGSDRYGVPGGRLLAIERLSRRKAVLESRDFVNS
jgi:hypothetical protein